MTLNCPLHPETEHGSAPFVHIAPTCHSAKPVCVMRFTQDPPFSREGPGSSDSCGSTPSLLAQHWVKFAKQKNGIFSSGVCRKSCIARTKTGKAKIRCKWSAASLASARRACGSNGRLLALISFCLAPHLADQPTGSSGAVWLQAQNTPSILWPSINPLFLPVLNLRPCLLLSFWRQTLPGTRPRFF